MLAVLSSYRAGSRLVRVLRTLQWRMSIHVGHRADGQPLFRRHQSGIIKQYTKGRHA